MRIDRPITCVGKSSPHPATKGTILEGLLLIFILCLIDVSNNILRNLGNLVDEEE